MRKFIGIGAVVLGVLGVLLCATAVGMSWWAAATINARLVQLAARLELGLSEVDLHLIRVESRLNAIQTDFDAVRGAAEKVTAENLALPRVQAEIELIIDRLVPSVDRADTLAESLRFGAAGLRTAADIVEQLHDDLETTILVRNAADKIDRAAESLNDIRARVEALKSAKAVQWTHELGILAREAIASSERIAEGLADVRQGISLVRARSAEWIDDVVWRVNLVATASTLVWVWGGLAQLCLIGWGRRRFDVRAALG